MLRALQPDPDDRWPDIASFTAAFRAAVPAPTPGSAQPTIWELPGTTDDAAPDRRPVWPIVVVSLVVFLVAFGAAYVVTSRL